MKHITALGIFLMGNDITVESSEKSSEHNRDPLNQLTQTGSLFVGGLLAGLFSGVASHWF